jgi:hypothetical protein
MDFRNAVQAHSLATGSSAAEENFDLNERDRQPSAQKLSLALRHLFAVRFAELSGAPRTVLKPDFGRRETIEIVREREYLDLFVLRWPYYS